LAGDGEVGFKALLSEPQNTIDAANQQFNYGVKPGLPPGTPAAVGNASWGDPTLIATVLAYLIRRAFS